MIAKFNKKILTTFSTEILLKNFTIDAKSNFLHASNVEQSHNRRKKQEMYASIVEQINILLLQNLTIDACKIPYTQVYRYVCRLITCRPHNLPKLVRARTRDGESEIYEKTKGRKFMPKKINGGDRFFMPMIPPTKTNQEKGINFKSRRVYTTDGLKDAEAKFDAHLFSHRPDEPLTGAVRLLVHWMFPVTGKHKDGEWKTTKPDVDNSVKTLIDRMTRLGFWKDDAQIVGLLIEKRYSEIPGIYIAYEAIKEAE